MDTIYQIIIPALLAFLGTLWVHPKVLKIAVNKNLVDNPDARKLQRRPVPNMGGSAVFFGIVIGLCSSNAIFSSPNSFMIVAAMLIMLYTGIMDDIIGLTPRLRFIIEILIVCWIMYVNKASISCFYGFWGIGVMPAWVSYPLTILSCVGIINAINLIDGVNGLSSGFCFMASVFFAIMFHELGNTLMMAFAVVAAGAIVPFFLHNVFGHDSKMFIGDSGTLVFGTMMSMFVISILNGNLPCMVLMHRGIGLLPFTLAVLSIPVFDTIRVMSTRILHKRSPFSPDKTHLHHMFIGLGFSHTGTTIIILTLNLIIIAAWMLAYQLGASVDVQMYVVLVMGVLFTFVLYNFSKRQIVKNGRMLRLLQRLGKSMNFEKKGVWGTIEHLIDKL